MEQVLQNLLAKICLVYLDNVIIFGKNFEEMILKLRKVFTQLREVNLKVNPKNYNLFGKDVKYLRL